jgi:CBS domain-containing protein
VSSATAVERSADIDVMLEGISVADVMDHDVSGVPPGLTLDTFADQIIDGATRAAVAVMRGPELLGIVGEKQIRRVRRDRWAATRAEDLMVSGDAMPSVGPEMSLRDALDQLHRSGLDGLPVLESGALTGIVTRRAVAKAVAEAARNRFRTGGASAS